MRILKFGGTSVGSPERMKALLNIVEPGREQIVVLSAVAGTTNKLVEICTMLHAKETKQAATLIRQLEESYEAFVEELFKDAAFKTKGKELITHHFAFLQSFTIDLFSSNEEKAILAQGELLSTALWHYYVQEQGISSVLLPALDFMRIDEDAEPVIAYTTEQLTPIIKQYPKDTLFITQGFICRNAFGEIDNLKRGGSDYTASLIGAALQAEEVQIWTDIDGMHNNDPRIVKNTKPVARLSFDEAAELAYFGAKILHPQSVLPARKYNVPVRLLNTLQPQAAGTLINNEQGEGGIKAIAAKDGITAINIQSSRMLLAFGFLRRVFEVFERHKTSIDMITTSEVAVSLTIDYTEQLSKIREELKEYGSIEIEKDLSIICVVGDLSGTTHGLASRIMDALKHIPIRMISYGASNYNISLLVKTEHKIEALKSLHSRLFE